MIDLRSDTVTKPTQAMLKAMFEAKVGDDVFEEEPTVNLLQEKIAKMFNKEAALFCPSGTMTNQIAIKCHTQPGDEVICDATAHIYNYEGGGISFNSGAQARLINGTNGKINEQQIVESINPKFDWLTNTSLVSIENTANRAGGSFYNLAEMESIAKICKEHQLKFHLDGARIFNAITEIINENNSELSFKEKLLFNCHQIGNLFDSISVCLSKGLGAPVGSVLLGDKTFIKKARRIRKVLGGGMRQAGYLAAAGIYALDNHIERLNQDHKRAKELSLVLSQMNFVKDVLPVYTNIVIFNLNEKITPEKFSTMLTADHIKVVAFGKQAVRFVTHLDFDDNMLEQTITALHKINKLM
jgi:threonine aldolase